MANVYVKADDSIITMVHRCIDNWYPDFVKVKLLVGILFVIGDNEKSPPLKENGQPTDGLIKIVSMKDRVSKGFDVEMILDTDEWNRGRDKHKVALLDHLLSRVEVKRPKKKKKNTTVHGSDEEKEQHDEEFLFDASGRPALKIRKSDLNSVIGFKEVIERHGPFAPEHVRMMIANDVTSTAMAEFRAATVVDVEK